MLANLGSLERSWSKLTPSGNIHVESISIREFDSGNSADMHCLSNCIVDTAHAHMLLIFTLKGLTVPELFAHGSWILYTNTLGKWQLE